ncbi:hypothetical protein [Rubrobacter calidifluminis]|uniref:hypothetical protein n=1 Tax=Rubrobacter calidifluminis TaxID=1392640 RepID=UPI00235DD7CF|nr:hypothetical protein [Rubrobacter calidifluminis]
MATLICTAKRVGDLESRTEEYQLAFAVDGSPKQELRIRYQAARAYEINAALDAAVEKARRAISEAGSESHPTDEALSQLAWRTLQSAKYERGEEKRNTLEL